MVFFKKWIVSHLEPCERLDINALVFLKISRPWLSWLSICCAAGWMAMLSSSWHAFFVYRQWKARCGRNANIGLEPSGIICNSAMPFGSPVNKILKGGLAMVQISYSLINAVEPNVWYLYFGCWKSISIASSTLCVIIWILASSFFLHTPSC